MFCFGSFLKYIHRQVILLEPEWLRVVVVVVVLDGC